MARDFGRWFRFYDAVLDDPKVQRLSDPLFRAWVNLMCLASRSGGQFSDNIDEIGFALRVSPAQASKLIEGLIKAGLLEHIDERFEPHNWNERQFKSDVSTERVKRFRQRSTKRTETVSETPPEAETDTEADQKQIRAEERAVRASPPTEPVLPPEPKKLGKREHWPQGGVVPEPWLRGAEAERRRLGLPPVDMAVVGVKFANFHIAKANQPRTQTEWQAAFNNFALDERLGKSNGSGGQHGDISLATKVFGGGYAAARAERERGG
jgi:hypothetical protein